MHNEDDIGCPSDKFEGVMTMTATRSDIKDNIGCPSDKVEDVMSMTATHSDIKENIASPSGNAEDVMTMTASPSDIKDNIACPSDKVEDLISKAASLTAIIRNRRSVFADYFIDKPVPKPVIEEVLTNAIWAPNYKMTQPWRFIVLQGEQLKQFGIYLADYYKSQYERLINYPSRAACIIVIIMRRSTKVVIEEWEELAAVACAVQNMALTCTACDIGGYWDSCAACIEYGNRFELSENERCLGFFYMGYYDLATYTSNKRRTGIEKKVTWLT